MLKKLPINVSDFANLRNGNYIYVDKTQIVYNLISQNKSYFLSRPRRFGKSLLISMLKELFSGKKDLFKDLWITKNTTYEWTQHPVMPLDFSTLSSTSIKDFEHNLCWALEHIARSYNVNLVEDDELVAKLTSLIEQLSKINSVVILIDEYDYQLLSSIDKDLEYETFHKIIQNFFGVINTLKAHVRFFFATGYSALAQSSLFSGMDNCINLSLDQRAHNIMGYTHQEVEDNFKPYLDEIAAKENLSREALMQMITKHYGGYSFDERYADTLYDTFSLLHFLRTGRFDDYWREYSIPSFLVKFINHTSQARASINNLAIPQSELGLLKKNNLHHATVLFQAGCLTISNYDSTTKTYTLNHPNEVVRDVFENYLRKMHPSQCQLTSGAILSHFKSEIEKGNPLRLLLEVINNLK